MPIIRSVLTVALVLLAGCKVMDEASKVLGIQMALAQEFQEPGLVVQPGPEGSLVVFFPGAGKTAKLPETERAAVARRVAEYVRDRYEGYPKLQAVLVGFMTRGSGGLTVSETDIPYRFTAAELGAPVPRPTQPKP